ncbi:MAG: hypothetical protein KJZ47_03745, partial [Gemmatimonadales bacterium]|nr:hypothetical protein [Gemmatimonadales bacterium]
MDLDLGAANGADREGPTHAWSSPGGGEEPGPTRGAGGPPNRSIGGSPPGRDPRRGAAAGGCCRAGPPGITFPTPSLPQPEPAISATWTIKDAEKLYNMKGWGLGFFRINDSGHVTVHPGGTAADGLDLYKLALDLNAQGIGLPLLLRFSDILRTRIENLATDFGRAITEFGYEAGYTSV